MTGDSMGLESTGEGVWTGTAGAGTLSGGCKVGVGLAAGCVAACAAPLRGGGFLRSTLLVAVAEVVGIEGRVAEEVLRGAEGSTKPVAVFQASISFVSVGLGLILSPVTVLEHLGHCIASLATSGRIQRAQKLERQQGT